MVAIKQFFARWSPAVLIMTAIFAVSSLPSYRLPDFQWADALVKKGGHMIGYGLLAVSFLHGLGRKNHKTLLLAWLLTLLYAASDEFHQSFVPGRHASIWDVLIFDNLGTLIGMRLRQRLTIATEEDGSKNRFW